MGESGPRGRAVLRRLAGIPVLAGALALSFAPAALAGGPCVGCSGTYSGSWSATYQRLEHHGGEREEHATINISLKWAAALTFQGGEGVWTLTSASGSFSISGSGSSGEDCSTTLSPGPGAIVRGEAFWIATAPGKGLNGEDEKDYETVVALPPVAWGQTFGANPLKSSSSSGGCGEQSNWGLGGPWQGDLAGSGCHYEAASGHDWIAFPRGGTHSENDTCQASGNDGRGDSWSGVSYNAQETLTVPGTGPGGGAVGAKGRPGPDYKKAKEDARADFKQHAIEDGTRYCLPYAGGLLGFGAGVLVLGAGPTIGGSLAVTGSITASALAPFCNATLTRLAKDLKTYRDPPLQSVHVLAVAHRPRVAALPSCGPPGSPPSPLASYCSQLSAAYLQLDATSQRVAADATAVEQTISRETAALRARNQSAANAQDAHLGSLLAAERVDRAALLAAGRSVAAVLRSAGIVFKIDKQQSGEVIAAALKQAARRGVTKSAIRSLAPGALAPQATDLGVALGRL